MFRFTTVVILAFLSQSMAFTDDDSDSTAQLLERIKKLEKRIEDLEAIAKKAPREVQPQIHAVPPSVYPQPSTLPNNGFLPRSTTVPPATIPNSWQPFEFNGQTYYIVPAKESQRQDGVPVDRHQLPNSSDGVQVLKSKRIYSDLK